jgi:hypothetical protein
LFSDGEVLLQKDPKMDGRDYTVVSEQPQPVLSGKLADPEFRTERARTAGLASQSAAGKISRFVAALQRGEFTDAQLDIVRRALPAVGAKAGE